MKTNRLFTLFIAVFTLLFFVNCKKDTVDMPANTASLPEKLTEDEANVLYWNRNESKTLNYEDAVTSVEYLVNIFSNDTRSGNKRTILNSTVLSSEVANPLSRSQAQADTAVYLFNFADNGGFVMVSGDIRTDRILCFIEKGNLNPDEIVDNPGFALFLAFAENSLQKQKERADSLTNVLLPDALEKAEALEKIEGSAADKAESRVTYHYEPTSIGVKPLLTVEWNQDSPFNDLAPVANAYAGCVAVAVGQIMAYWEKPASRPWADMKNGRYQPSEPVGSLAVAQLCWI